MGLLVCRRPRKSEGSTGTSEDTLTATKPATLKCHRTGLSLLDDPDQRADLRRLFRPALPSEQSIPITSLQGPSTIQDTTGSVKAAKLKERRRRLEGFSGRLRKGLSREPRFLGGSPRRFDKHRVRSLLLAGNLAPVRGAATPDHVLGSDLVSERDYDSDAQCISTPKGSDQAVELCCSTKSINKSLRSLPDDNEMTIREESEQFGSVRDDQNRSLLDNHNRQEADLSGTNDKRPRVSSSIKDIHSLGDAPFTKYSVEKASVRTFAEEIEFELSKNLPVEYEKCFGANNEGKLGQQVSPFHSLRTCVTKRNKDSMSLASLSRLSTMKASDKGQVWGSSPSKTGDDSCADEMTEPKMTRILTCPRASVGSLASLNGHELPLSVRPRYSNHARSLSEQDPIRLNNMNISKRLASLSVEPPGLSRDRSLVSDRENHSVFGSIPSDGVGPMGTQAMASPGSVGLNPTQNGNRGRNISSFYLSQASSLPSSSGDFTHQLPLEIPAPVYSKDIIIVPKRCGPTRGHRCYAPLHSDLVSLTQNSGVDFANEPPTAIGDSLPATNATQSRFREQFEADVSAAHSAAVHSKRDPKVIVSRSVSVGWMSGGRRLGYGYTFVSNDGDESSRRPSTFDMSFNDESPISTDRPSLDGRVCNTWKRQPADQDEGMFLTKLPLSVDGILEGSLSNDNCRSRSGEVQGLSGRKSGKDESLQAKSERVWAKFASHARTERNGPASHTDNVIVRDFYSHPNPDDVIRRNLDKQKERRNSTGRRGPKFIQQWTKIYRSKSVETRRYRAGLTNEAARYREPEFPELQTIGSTYKEELGDYKEEVRKFELRRKQRADRAVRTELSTQSVWSPKSVQQTSAENESFSTRMPVLRPAQDPEENMQNQESPSTAQEWSRIYEECVEIPSDEIDQEQLSPAVAKDKGTKQTSSFSEDLRNSDSEFRRTQLANEMNSRNELLKRIQDAWGSNHE